MSPLARIIATVGRIGRLPGPTGAWASAVAISLAWGLHWLGGFPLFALATAAVAAAGFRAARGVARDPGEIVLGAVAGQWVALWPLSAGLWHAGAAAHVFPWPGWVGAFVFFRLFAVWRPAWLDRADRGSMRADLVAGAMAAVVVAAMAAVAHGLMR